MVESARRRLAAVMFTDITGYTAMVQRDEQIALNHVARYREVHNSSITSFHGRIIQFYGDGSLSIFDSAIDAVRCAIQMQQKFATEPVVPVRIGIHLGDVVMQDDTVYGDGVNIASRIETQGLPGSILVSSSIQKEIANQSDIQTKVLGDFDLKNVSERVRIFAVSNPGLVVPNEHQKPAKPHKYLRILAILALVALAVYILYRQVKQSAYQKTQVRTERIAIPLFVDYTGSGDSTMLPQMAADWILKELIETPNVKVVAFESATNTALTSLVSERATARAFSNRTGAINILKGEIYPVEDSLEFHAQIMHLETGEFIQPSWSSKCAPVKPMKCITNLASQIRGFWTSKDAHVLSPPNFDAYKHYLRARAVWIEDYTQAEQELHTAIAADPTFIDAYFLLMDLYYNKGRYASFAEWKQLYADWEGLIETVTRKFPDLTPRQRNLLELEKSQLRGELARTYQLFQTELAIDPKDPFINMSGMVYAVEYVNAPEVAIELFNLIPEGTQDLDQCKICVDRVRLATRAYLRLGNLKSAQRLAEILPTRDIDNLQLRVRVYAAQKDTARLNALIRSARNDIPQADHLLNYRAGHEFSLLKNAPLKSFYTKRALGALSSNQLSADLIRTLYLEGAYDSALVQIKPWLTQYDSNSFVQLYAGLLYARLGMIDSVQERIEMLEALKNSYEYGWYSYYQARIYLHAGQKEMALDKLEQAFAEGMDFTDNTMQNDPDLMPLFDNPRFKKLLHPLE